MEIILHDVRTQEVINLTIRAAKNINLYTRARLASFKEGRKEHPTYTKKGRKTKEFGHILPMNLIMKHVTEVNTEGKEDGGENVTSYLITLNYFKKNGRE
jgi:hypothetical protein